LYDLGTTYFRERDYGRASEWFARVREEFAGVEDWYTLSMLALGECYEQLQQKKEAIDAYTTVAELRPDDDYGKTALARVKRLKGGRR
jgi:TolA-binding protein